MINGGRHRLWVRCRPKRVCAKMILQFSVKCTIKLTKRASKINHFPWVMHGLALQITKLSTLSSICLWKMNKMAPLLTACSKILLPLRRCRLRIRPLDSFTKIHRIAKIIVSFDIWRVSINGIRPFLHKFRKFYLGFYIRASNIVRRSLSQLPKSPSWPACTLYHRCFTWRWTFCSYHRQRKKTWWSQYLHHAQSRRKVR